jgi:hypothetical protein
VVLAGIFCFATVRYGVGRRFWVPAYRALAGARSHDQVLEALGPRHRAALRDAAAASGLDYPPGEITLVGLKEERALEVWGRSSGGWVLFRTYPVLAASGGPGPKLREGDGQVPEGIYNLSGFNPNSSYHLSIKVDYPNQADREAAAEDGRTNLGGDIFIHGKAVSIGCLAIGDPAIEELYLLAADVGLRRVRVLLAPSATPQPAIDARGWLVQRYEHLHAELAALRTPPSDPN